jgi:alpha-galactosidase
MKSNIKIFFSLIFCISYLFLTQIAAQEETIKSEFKKWAETPPMGWNSWDCFGPTVNEEEVKANADYMAKHLKKYGWEYIVVDIRWYANDSVGGYNRTDPIYSIDEYGRYLPSLNKFPSASNERGFKELADYIHNLGLKFGIHIMRGIPTLAVENKLPIKGVEGITADMIYTTDLQCRWLPDNYTIVADKPGAQEYYNSILELYASWGVDFIKVDNLSNPYHKEEIELIRNAIDNVGRPIVFSTSPGETPIEEGNHISAHANMWRMVDDVWDRWEDIRHLMDIAPLWTSHISPGTWPDCDMLPLGKLSVRGNPRRPERMTLLTEDEQYTLMTLFTICRSPLMFGGNMPENDAFTNSLLTNTEVLDMHRESVGNRLVSKTNDIAIWTAENPQTGDIYLALFNISDNPIPIEVKLDLETIGINQKVKVFDMWANQEMGIASNEFAQQLNAHASRLYKLVIIK